MTFTWSKMTFTWSQTSFTFSILVRSAWTGPPAPAHKLALAGTPAQPRYAPLKVLFKSGLIVWSYSGCGCSRQLCCGWVQIIGSAEEEPLMVRPNLSDVDQASKKCIASWFFLAASRCLFKGPFTNDVTLWGGEGVILVVTICDRRGGGGRH